MKRSVQNILLIWLFWFAPNCRAGNVTTFDDIEFWVGTGANRAALAIDWQGNGTADHALVWGYRWSDEAHGEDMLRAVVAADPRLYAKVGMLGGLGLAVFGLGYDANDDGQFALDDQTHFDPEGFALTDPSDLAASVDPDDWYQEGWFIGGFWHYGTSEGSPFEASTWTTSHGGPFKRILSDGSWDSLAFTPSYSTQAFAQNAIAAPGPPSADFDADGDVDGRDMLAWLRGFGLREEASRADGDANHDDAVDGLDLAIWSEQFGVVAGTQPFNASFSAGALESAGLAVPEPHALVCFCLTASCWLVGFPFVRFSARR